jgi:hypothetical protein
MRRVLVPDETDFVQPNPRVGTARVRFQPIRHRKKAKARRQAGLRSGEAGTL